MCEIENRRDKTKTKRKRARREEDNEDLSDLTFLSLEFVFCCYHCLPSFSDLISTTTKITITWRRLPPPCSTLVRLTGLTLLWPMPLFFMHFPNNNNKKLLEPPWRPWRQDTHRQKLDRYQHVWIELAGKEMLWVPPSLSLCSLWVSSLLAHLISTLVVPDGSRSIVQLSMGVL